MTDPIRTLAPTMAGQRHPNILVVVPDQLRSDALGCAYRTPSIDRLAREGARFTSAYCNAPLCMLARASVLTGTYPHNHHIQRNAGRVPAGGETLATLLRGVGYRNAYIGKCHYFWDGPGRSLIDNEPYMRELGFDDVHLTAGPRASFHSDSYLTRHWRERGLLDVYKEDFERRHREGGLAKDTLVVFWSDHGEMGGDHQRIYKSVFYESSVRVPLIWSWPGHLKAGVRSDALVELMDIMPTLMELAGLAVPEGTQGRSLLPLLTGGGAMGQHRDSVRCEYHRALSLKRNGARHRQAGPTGTHATMLRDRRYKLVVYHGLGMGELFDLEKDPGEFENLWNSSVHAGVKCDLMQQSFDALALAIDTGPPQVARF